MSTSASHPDGPDRLLSQLAREVGWISKHGETLVTESLALLLLRPGLEAALRQLVTSRSRGPLPALTWRAEHRLPGQGRPDLAGLLGEHPAAFVEAKLGARLTVDQLLEYTWHLSQAQRSRSGQAGGSTAVLVVLVPVARGQEADRVIEAAFGTPGLHAYGLPPGAGDVQVIRLTWDDVAAALRGADVGRNSAQDVEQFISLVRALEGMEIAPFTEHELADGWEQRREDYAHVVDRTTAALSHLPRLLPIGADASLRDRRYLVPEPNGPELAVGLRDPATSGVSKPLWMRYHANTSGVEDVRSRLAQSAFAGEVCHDHGHVWLPLSPATGVGSVAVVDDLMEQVLVRDQAARGSSALRVAATHRLPAQGAVPVPSGTVNLDWHGRSVSPDMLLYQVLCGRTRAELLEEFRAKQGDLDHLRASGLIADYHGDYRLTAAGARFRAGSHDYDGGGDLDQLSPGNEES